MDETLMNKSLEDEEDPPIASSERSEKGDRNVPKRSQIDSLLEVDTFKELSETIKKLGPIDLPPEEMVRCSSVLMEAVFELNSEFRRELEKSRLTVSKREVYSEIWNRLAQIARRQHTWLVLLHGKTSKKKRGNKGEKSDGASNSEPATISDEAVPQKSSEESLGETEANSTKKLNEAAASDGFALVKSKSAKRRERKLKHRLQGDTFAEKTKKSGAQDTENSATLSREVSKRKPIKVARKPQKEYVLLVRPVEGITQTSDQTLEFISNNVDPMREKLAIRTVRKISGGGILISTETQTDLERLESKLGDLASNANLSCSRPVERNPEYILFGVDQNLNKDDIVDALKAQNECLAEASVELRKEFKGKTGRNVIISVDRGSYERLTGTKRLNVGWTRVDFRASIRPIVCYKCWKYGHVKKHCHSVDTLCGNCGSVDHVEAGGCEAEPSCPNCIRASSRNPKSKRDTAHKPGSRDCPIHLRELERLRLKHYG